MLNPSSINRLFLTFDDGLSPSCLRAAEYLSSKGICAVFFIVPGWIDATCDYTDFYNPRGSHLSWKDCEAIIDMGHIIGSHTNTHKELVMLGVDVIEREVFDAKEKIKTRLFISCEAIAMPFNRYNEKIINIVSKYHKFIRLGPHFPIELDSSNSIYPSISLTDKLIHKLQTEGVSCLSNIVKRKCAIFQCHGFDGQGWESFPFTMFKEIVCKYSNLFIGDNLLTFVKEMEL